MTASIIFLGQINRIAFRIGSWPVYWYGIIIGLGMLAAYLVYQKEVQRKGIDQDKAFDLLFWAIIFGFIGARLYYVLFSWEQYSDNLMSIFSIWQGGIAIYGGVIAGLLTIILYCWKKELPLVLMLDISAPALMIAQSIGRWGNFMNQEAYGGITSRLNLERLALPDFVIQQMYIQGEYRQPTFLYESVWNFIGFILLLILRRQKGLLREGEVAAGYAIWYGAGRAYIEGMRSDSLYLGGLRVSQWVSMFLVVAAVVFIAYRRRQPLNEVPTYTASDQRD